MIEIKRHTKRVEETVALGSVVGAALEEGSVIALYGDLGAGKTHFVQGIAQGMGITEPVVSPTFTILNYYDNHMPLQHFDFYRVEEQEELENIGFYDYIQQGVSVIEWAEKFEDLLPDKTMKIRIEKTGEGTREITFSFPDHPIWENVIKEVQQDDISNRNV